MADETIRLRSREEIMTAREMLYGGLVKNEMPPDRAAVIEKVLRGQEDTAIVNPLKFLQMISGNKRFEVYAAEVAAQIGQFVNPKALKA